MNSTHPVSLRPSAEGLSARSSSTPSLVEALAWAGALAHRSRLWDDSPRLDPMPRGPGVYPAPPPSLPPGVDGPWPQKPPFDPAFYAPVLDVPVADRLDHVRFIVSRYLRQLATEVPGAAARALGGPRLKAVDDDELSRILTETSLGQFLLPLADGDAGGAFAEIVASSAGSYGTMDFTFVAPPETRLPGMYVAPVEVLARHDGARWKVVAIRVDRRVVRPTERNAWELARWYALQAAQTRLVCSAHPRLHFPSDVINAVTRAVVPAGHALRELIEPHTRFTLGLHEAVIYNRRSVIHNSQREIYTPFPYTTEGMHLLVIAGKQGVAGNAAWPEWRYGDLFVGDHVPYGRYRAAWLDAMTRFAAEALAEVAPGDAVVRAWADHIASWLPGFPDGRAIEHEGALARAVALYLCTVSVFHTGDHHSYANIGVDKLPWRLRVEMPAEGPVARVDPDALVTAEDVLRWRLAHAMFFKPSVITSLRDVKYRFRSAGGRRAVARWRDAMTALDERWSRSGFPSSHEIGSGVHY